MSAHHPEGDAPERAAAWSLARGDRGDHDPPHEVHLLADLDALRSWAREHNVRVHLISTDARGRHIYVAHAGRQSRVAKGPPRERIWSQAGFQT